MGEDIFWEKIPRESFERECKIGIKMLQFPVPPDEFPVSGKKLPVPDRTGNRPQRTGIAAQMGVKT
jgi:hypothetical protein